MYSFYQYLFVNYLEFSSETNEKQVIFLIQTLYRPARKCPFFTSFRAGIYVALQVE